MSAPRITLWTAPFRMPFRMSILSLSGQPLVRQIADTQESTHRFMEITPGFLGILSHVAGRRMTEPTRWILFDSLRDVLNGRLRTSYPERQDLLAATFGELLGAVFLATRLGGNIEVIRFLESNRGKTPDFLLLQTTESGQSAHTLECKGRVEDVNNINEHIRPKTTTEFDLCRDMRKLRGKAMAQVNSIVAPPFKTGARTVLQQKIPFGITSHSATKNIIVSSVPDSRAIGQSRSSVLFASRPQCLPSNVKCNMCMTNTQSNLSQSNVISAHYQSRIKRNSILDRALTQFIVNYQTVQRSLWSGNDDAFDRALREFLETCSTVSTRDWFSSAFFLLIPVFEAATQDGFTHLDFDTHSLQTLFQYVPEDLQSIWEEVFSEFGQAAQRRGSRTIERVPRNPTRDGTIYWRLGGTRQDELLWYETDPGMISVADFADEFRSATQLFETTFRNAAIYGSVYYEDRSTILIHLISFTKNYDALKTYVEGIVRNLRKEEVAYTSYSAKGGNPPKLRWREEYAREIFKEEPRLPFVIGESWDEFPYPHPTRNLPGITTWVARDGRAEIIVRKREHR